jgi:hypothetical protein
VKILIPNYTSAQKISVVVDNYTIVNFPQEVYNTATLISLAK